MTAFRLLALSSIFLTIACEGPSGLNGLVDISDEPAGANCASGGVKVASGLDENENGVLDPDEVTQTKFVCDGSNGINSLLLSAVEPAGENCAKGGTKIQFGRDLNSNGQLEASEIEQTRYVCTGANGIVSLVVITDVAAGTECYNGGVKVQSGEDTNSNGQLNESEIKMTKFVCDGEDGAGPKEVRVFSIGFGTTPGTASLGLGQEELFPPSTTANLFYPYDDFDIAMYPGYDSVILMVYQIRVFGNNEPGFVAPPEFRTIMELSRKVNGVDVVIPGSQVSLTPGTERRTSANFRAGIPQGLADLGISIRTNDPRYTSVANVVMILYSAH